MTRDTFLLLFCIAVHISIFAPALATEDYEEDSMTDNYNFRFPTAAPQNFEVELLIPQKIKVGRTATLLSTGSLSLVSFLILWVCRKHKKDGSEDDAAMDNDEDGLARVSPQGDMTGTLRKPRSYTYPYARPGENQFKLGIESPSIDDENEQWMDMVIGISDEESQTYDMRDISERVLGTDADVEPDSGINTGSHTRKRTRTITASSNSTTSSSGRSLPLRTLPRISASRRTSIVTDGTKSSSIFGLEIIDEESGEF